MSKLDPQFQTSMKTIQKQRELNKRLHISVDKIEPKSTLEHNPGHFISNVKKTKKGLVNNRLSSSTTISIYNTVFNSHKLHSNSKVMLKTPQKKDSCKILFHNKERESLKPKEKTAKALLKTMNSKSKSNKIKLKNEEEIIVKSASKQSIQINKFSNLINNVYQTTAHSIASLSNVNTKGHESERHHRTAYKSRIEPKFQRANTGKSGENFETGISGVLHEKNTSLNHSQSNEVLRQ